MWRTLATESRYLFYRMGWVNPESDRTTEIKFPPWVGFESATSLIDSPACYRWAITAPNKKENSVIRLVISVAVTISIWSFAYDSRPFIAMKQCVSWPWNTLFYLDLRCFMVLILPDSTCFAVFHDHETNCVIADSSWFNMFHHCFIALIYPLSC